MSCNIYHQVKPSTTTKLRTIYKIDNNHVDGLVHIIASHVKAKPGPHTLSKSKQSNPKGDNFLYFHTKHKIIILQDLTLKQNHQDLKGQKTRNTQEKETKYTHNLIHPTLPIPKTSIPKSETPQTRPSFFRGGEPTPIGLPGIVGKTAGTQPPGEKEQKLDGPDPMPPAKPGLGMNPPIPLMPPAKFWGCSTFSLLLSCLPPSTSDERTKSSIVSINNTLVTLSILILNNALSLFHTHSLFLTLLQGRKA